MLFQELLGQCFHLVGSLRFAEVVKDRLCQLGALVLEKLIDLTRRVRLRLQNLALRVQLEKADEGQLIDMRITLRVQKHDLPQ